jgi:iron complex transport system substrate-binding protein
MDTHRHLTAHIAVAALVLLAILTTGCSGLADGTSSSDVTATPAVPPTSPPAPTDTPIGPIEVTDGLGRSVSLSQPARRIVSMAASNTEILYAIGAGDQIVGRDEFSDFPPAVLDVPSVGGGFNEYNQEAIVALDPDLVIAGGINTPEQVDSLENLGLTVFYLANPLDFEGLFANLRIAGMLAGREEEADALIEDLQGRLDAIYRAIDGVEPVSVFFEVDGTDPRAPWTTGTGTFQDYLIEQAVGINVADIEYWGQIGLEDLISRDPQVIIFSQAPYIPTTAESFAERPGWADLSAVEQGRIVGVDTNLVDRPGPRLVDALEAFARALHPERFP